MQKKKKIFNKFTYNSDKLYATRVIKIWNNYRDVIIKKIIITEINMKFNLYCVLRYYFVYSHKTVSVYWIRRYIFEMLAYTSTLWVYCNIHFSYLTITRLSLYSFYYCYTSCSKKFLFHFLLAGPTPHINFGSELGLRSLDYMQTR